LRILITGGNGFLGRRLVAALQRRGASVRVLALPNENTAGLGGDDVTVFRGDIRSPDTLAAPMDGVDCVFHLAAMIGVWASPESYSAVNVEGTANVCRAALHADVKRVVHISSAMVYDMTGPNPASEDDPLVPLDEPYCLSKAQGDLLVQRMISEEQLPAVIIRPGTLVGPGDALNFGRMATRIRAGRGVVIGRGKNAIPLFSLEDMVQALLLAMESETSVGEIFNIAHDDPITQAEYLSLIARELNAPQPRIRVPYTSLYAAAYLAERLAAASRGRIKPFLTRHGVKLYGADNRISIDKARRELGYAPAVSVGEAVTSACRWLERSEQPTPSRAPTAMTGAATH
jgi:nucleoside-diphosphate-sugar epimerase